MMASMAKRFLMRQPIVAVLHSLPALDWDRTPETATFLNRHFAGKRAHCSIADLVQKPWSRWAFKWEAGETEVPSSVRSVMYYFAVIILAYHTFYIISQFNPNWFIQPQLWSRAVCGAVNFCKTCRASPSRDPDYQLSPPTMLSFVQEQNLHDFKAFLLKPKLNNSPAEMSAL